MKPAVLRPQALRDQQGEVRYYRKEGGTRLAVKMAQATNAALDQVELDPGIGSPAFGKLLGIPGLRTWRVAKFPLLWCYFERGPGACQRSRSRAADGESDADQPATRCNDPPPGCSAERAGKSALLQHGPVLMREHRPESAQRVGRQSGRTWACRVGLTACKPDAPNHRGLWQRLRFGSSTCLFRWKLWPRKSWACRLQCDLPCWIASSPAWMRMLLETLHGTNLLRSGRLNWPTVRFSRHHSTKFWRACGLRRFEDKCAPGGGERADGCSSFLPSRGWPGCCGSFPIGSRTGGHPAVAVHRTRYAYR